MQTETTSRRLRVAGIMLVIAVVDQLIKMWVLHSLEPGVPYPVIGDWFRFTLVFNSGAAFSIGRHVTWLFTCVQIAGVLGLLLWSHKLRHPYLLLAGGLIAGGALGNLIDRLLRPPAFFVGHVVDYVSVGSFAIFNFADAAITIGSVVIVLWALFASDKSDKESGTQAGRESGNEARTGASPEAGTESAVA